MHKRNGTTDRRDGNATTQRLTATDQVRGLWESLRPYQWSKNLLVFGGLIFSGNLADPRSCLLSVLAFVIFCALTSAGYILNDLLDVSSDRHHPLKQNRPLAAGRVSPALAAGVMAGLAAAALFGAAALSRPFLATVVGYAVLSVAYTVYLKRLMIVDVLALSFGFVLRAIAGAAVLEIEPSSWLVICTMMLALLVGFGKRRAEVILLGDEASRHRSTLERYTVDFLDTMTLLSAGVGFLS